MRRGQVPRFCFARRCENSCESNVGAFVRMHCACSREAVCSLSRDCFSAHPEPDGTDISANCEKYEDARQSNPKRGYNNGRQSNKHQGCEWTPVPGDGSYGCSQEMGIQTVHCRWKCSNGTHDSRSSVLIGTL